MKRKINMKVIYKEISNIFKYLFLENVKSHVPVTSKRLIQIKKSKLTFFFNCVKMIFVLLLYDDCVPLKYASFWPIYWTKMKKISFSTATLGFFSIQNRAFN